MDNPNNGNYRLRTAAGDDVAQSLELLRSARLPSEGVADHLSDGYVVAEKDGRVVGLGGIEVHGPYGLLRSVVVDDAHKGNALGADIVRERLEWARVRGLRAVYLLTETAPGFFERLGFERVARGTFPEEVRASWEFTSGCCDSATAMKLDLEKLHTDTVKQKYGEAATRVLAGKSTSCCGDSCSSNPVTSDLYDDVAVKDLPAGAVTASLGCGNPTALIELDEGETVLDLGSGGGLDVLLTARRVGPAGKVYGLDMTDEMLALARENQRKAGVTNVEFLRGRIEEIPLPTDTVDVVISNCVINLSPDKPRTLAEAFRVLKPGGRFAVSDIVADRPVPDHIRKDIELVLGCVGGSMETATYRRLLEAAGFVDIEIEPTRVYTSDDINGLGEDRVHVADVDGMFMSAFVRARKPV